MRPPTQSGDRRPAAIWNAARCKRLLRPLQNRIAILRRLKCSAAYSDKEGQTRQKTPARTLGGASLGPDKSTCRKKPGKKYSQRRGFPPEATIGISGPAEGKRGVVSTTLAKAPGSGANIATPLIRRVRLLHIPHMAPPGDSTSPFRSPALVQWQRHPPLNRHLTACLRDLGVHRERLGEASFRTYEGILRDLVVVLSAVKTVEAADKKSLLSMCLRRVPSRVAMVAGHDMLGNRGAAHRATDPVGCIYDELETLGQGAAGWRHLSIVARSHALLILRDAVTDGLFAPCVVGVLTQCYRLHGYQDDALDLLEAMASEDHPEPRGPQSTFKEHESLEKLRILTDASDGAESHVPDLYLLRLMLHRQGLPLAWLSTREFRSCWARLAVSLDRGRTSAAGLQLFQSAVAALCSPQPLQPEWQQGTAPDDCALVAVVGAIVSVALVITDSFSRPHESPDTRSSWHGVRKTGLRVLRGALLEASNIKARPQAIAVLRLGICFLADKSSIQLAGDFQRGVDETPKQPAMSDDVCELAATLICSITRCSSRALARPPCTLCSWLCDRLEAGQVVTHEAIRADAAFMVAQETDDLRDLVFAEAIRSTTQMQHRISDGAGAEATSSVFAGYRWEDGISEWVVTSPGTRKSTMGRGAISGSTNSESRPQLSLKRPRSPLPSGQRRSGMVHTGLEGESGRKKQRGQGGRITPRTRHVVGEGMRNLRWPPRLPADSESGPESLEDEIRPAKGRQGQRRLAPLALLPRLRESLGESEDELLV